MNNSPVKSELYVALENGRINSILTIYKKIKHSVTNKPRLDDTNDTKNVVDT